MKLHATFLLSNPIKFSNSKWRSRFMHAFYYLEHYFAGVLFPAFVKTAVYRRSRSSANVAKYCHYIYIYIYIREYIIVRISNNETIHFRYFVYKPSDYITKDVLIFQGTFCYIHQPIVVVLHHIFLQSSMNPPLFHLLQISFNMSSTKCTVHQI